MKVIKLDATVSTNLYLKSLLNKEKLDDLTVVVSNFQKEGRGRNGRTWEGDPSLNVAFSIYKRFEKLKVKDQFFLNILSSISVFELLKKYNLNELSIKWPNDIMSENKKISGILIENNVKGDMITHSVIGVGINVNQSKFKNLSNATSILIQTGIKNSIDEINLNLHHIFKSNFMDFFNKMSFFLDQYNSVLFRKRISSEFIIDRNKNFFGEIVVVSQRGLIRIKKSDGTYEDFHENEIKMKF